MNLVKFLTMAGALTAGKKKGKKEDRSDTSSDIDDHDHVPGAEYECLNEGVSFVLPFSSASCFRIVRDVEKSSQVFSHPHPTLSYLLFSGRCHVLHQQRG